jgi:cell division septation protein DedD
MEKQKIFWVILSVTVFVVVVLVVGLFLLKRSPAGLAVAPVAAEPAATMKPAGTPTGIYEFGRDASSAEGDTEVLRFVIGGGETGTPGAGEGSVPAAPGAASSAPALPSASSAAAKPAATAPAAAKPAASAAAKPAAKAPAAKAAATARGPEYWIQTGSYKSQTLAEELSQTLTEKGLAGRVFSYAKSNETYFRVRIGPYTNKQEAEKFLAIVRQIQGLEASYISLVPGTRSLN